MQADGGELIIEAGDFHVVHDDELFKISPQAVALPGVGIHQQILAAMVNIHVAQNVALNIQQEAVRPAIERQVSDVVGDHAIHPADAVWAADAQLASPSQIEDAGALAQCGVFAGGIAEAERSLNGAIFAHAGAGGSEDVMEWCAQHRQIFDYSELLRPPSPNAKGGAP